MLTTLIGLELALLDKLTREQLIASLMEHREHLSLQFTRGWLERQTTEGLQFFLLAAKLLRVLRCQPPRPLL
jgi:hypothetical protein